MTSAVNNTYFSDHIAVKVQLRFRQNNQEHTDFNISVWVLSKGLAS